MKKKLISEINEIKSLINYDRKNSFLYEEIEVTTTTTTEPQNPITKKTEEKQIEKSPQELMREASIEICSKSENIKRCQSCGEVAKNLELGQLKEKQIENCLECKKKTGTDYLQCNDLKGKMLAVSGKIGTDKENKGVETRTSGWVLLGSTILTLFKDIKSMFTKDTSQGPM